MNGDGGGQDWWAQNDPGINTGPMQTQSAPPAAPAANPTATMPNVYGSQQGALTGGGGPQPGHEQEWFMNLVGNRPWNQQTLNELVPTLEQYGFKQWTPNAIGEQTKLQLPNGQVVRVGFGEGHPVWIPQSPPGGADSYSGPGAIPPPFQAPSFEDLQKEPGFQARLAMGQQGLEHSAAAQGSLLSGGFQKSLNKFSQDYASNEYGAAYDRAARTYNTNWQTQSVDPWNRYKDLYLGGLDAAGKTKTTPPL